jgi:hypothetical protein
LKAVIMPDGESKSAGIQAVAARFPLFMPLEQKVLLTVFFACTAGQDRPIEESHIELAALCGMDLANYLASLLELRIAGIIAVDHTQGLLINRDAIQNSKIIDELAAKAAERVQGQCRGQPDRKRRLPSAWRLAGLSTPHDV